MAVKKNLLLCHSGGFWKDYTFKKAKELGYGVIVAQKNYKKTNPYIDTIIDIDIYNAELVLDNIIPYSDDIHGVTTFFELAVETSALIAEILGLIGNSYTSAQNCRNKYRMRQCFENNNIPSVKAYALVSNPSEVKKFGCEYGYPIILKPTKFGAAAGVVRINNEIDVSGLFQFVQTEVSSFCKTYSFPQNQVSLMVETMIDPDSKEINVDMVIHKGEPIVVSIAEKPQNTAGPTFQENDYVMPPISLTNEHLEIVKDIALRAVSVIGLTCGTAHLEAKVMEWNGKLDCRIIEVGARCGGDLEVPAVCSSTNIDLSEIVIKQAMGDFSDADFLKLKNRLSVANKPVAVQVIYAPKNGIIKNILIPDSIKNDPRLLEMKFEYNQNDEIRMHYSDYVGAIMVTDGSSQKALELANKFASSIRVEMQ